jgi:DNA-binding NarL/FixJ family response regulator
LGCKALAALHPKRQSPGGRRYRSSATRRLVGQPRGVPDSPNGRCHMVDQPILHGLWRQPIGSAVGTAAFALVADKGCEAMRGGARREFQGTVLIADDHEVFRIGLTQLLRRSLKVKKFLEADCFADVIELLKERDVTLMILDLGMPGFSGPKDISQMRLLRPDTKIVVLSASDSREDILEVLSAGVHGYIVKNQHSDQLVDRLRYVLSGEIYVPAVLAELRSEPSNRETQPPQKMLSSRQCQVLKGLVEGKTNKAIARSLGVAEGTVKMHLATLFRVLGATNRAHAAALGQDISSEKSSQ